MTRPGAVRGRIGARLCEPHDTLVRSTWRRLQRDGGVATPFLAWEWFDALVATRATRVGVRVIVVDEGTRPIGLLPFECTTDHRGLRVVRPAGGPWLAPDHLDVVAHRRDHGVVADAAVGLLRAWRRFDAIDFDGLADNSALHAALAGQCRPPRFAPLPVEPAVLPYVALTRDEPDRLLSRNTRKQMRRAERTAEADGGGFEVHTDPSQIASHLPEMMDLHDARFGATSQIYRGAARRAFHLRAARQLAAEGLVRLYRLARAHDSVALLYALVWHDRVLAYGGGIRAGAGTPGHALTALAITSAAHEGFATFDLLRGDSGWKRRFASGAVLNHHVRCAAIAPRPVATHARWIARRAARRIRAGSTA